MKLFLRLLLLICCSASTAVNAARTQAHLLLSAQSAKAGETIIAGLQLQMPPQWHTYWQNQGDSGLPTKIVWTLPPGVTAGDIQWPVPEKLTVEGLTTYVYNNEVVLLVPLKIATSVPPGTLNIKAKVSWLECEASCIPGKAEVESSLEIGSETAPSFDASKIQLWQNKLPVKAAVKAKASWGGAAKGDTRPLTIDWETAEKAVDFFPFAMDGFEVQGATEIAAKDGHVQLHKMVKRLDEKKDWPKSISGLLVEKVNTPEGKGTEVTLKLEGASAEAASSSAEAGTASSAPPLSIGFLLGKLAAAFLGGLILNIMPCVLPVIALKIFGFVQQSKEAPERVFRLGLVYTLGVVVSFLVLAGMVIAVKAAGGAASWGMQMQYPQYRLALTIVATLVALNLFGVFEVTLPGRAVGSAVGLASKKGASGAFFNGVLATAMATPCTAPFLAPAVGFAFVQPSYIIVLMFLAIALGLASPYLILSWQPSWLKFLPKPGPWMEKFKHAMGFPMLAAAVWLFSLTAPSYGTNGVLGLALFLLCLSGALWIFGQFIQRGASRRLVAWLSIITVVGVGYGYGVRHLMFGSDQIAWRKWSPAAVETARQKHLPVLVDFTASWCVTCQVNKTRSIEIPSVREKLKEIKAEAFIADNTDVDPQIIAELQKYDRAGVPLVLVFPKDPSKPAIVLPDGIFSPDKMLAALDAASK